MATQAHIICNERLDLLVRVQQMLHFVAQSAINAQTGRLVYDIVFDEFDRWLGEAIQREREEHERTSRP